MGKRYRLNIKVSAEELKPETAPVIPIKPVPRLDLKSSRIQNRLMPLVPAAPHVKNTLELWELVIRVAGDRRG